MIRQKAQALKELPCIICGSIKKQRHSRILEENHVCSKKCSEIKQYRRKHTDYLNNIKVCKGCKLSKPLEDFRKVHTSYDGRKSRCKLCEIIKDKERHPIKTLKYRDKKLQKQYGITEEKYNTMAEEQLNRCYICNTNDLGKHNRLVVDHCHITNKVGRLLCSNCNIALGNFKDNVEILENAIQYLKDFR